MIPQTLLAMEHSRILEQRQGDREMDACIIASRDQIFLAPTCAFLSTNDDVDLYRSLNDTIHFAVASSAFA